MSQKKKLVTRLSIITMILSLLFWVALYFIGYFFASQILFYVIAIAILALVYFFTSKVSKRLALVLSVITFLVIAGVFMYGFEEDYCTRKGDDADRSGSIFVIATKDDEITLQSYEVKEGSQIGANFKVHMTCHESFDLVDALRDRFF